MNTAALAFPLDIGCGKLIPVQWSNLCVIYRYDHRSTCSRNVVEDKPFEMNVLVQTTRGRWTFHGKRGTEDVDSSLVVAGNAGDHYGCRHDMRWDDSNIIASFRPGALDDETPLFSNETLRVDTKRELERAIHAQTQDEFDSRVFELFDLASNASLPTGRARPAGSVRVQRMKRIIEDLAFESVSLDDIASSVGLSPFVCLRQFKAGTGITPHQYLSQLRLDRAVELLRKGNLPISAVARSVGINDQCYFSRWFTKSIGTSPSEFRALAR